MFTTKSQIGAVAARRNIVLQQCSRGGYVLSYSVAAFRRGGTASGCRLPIAAMILQRTAATTTTTTIAELNTFCRVINPNAGAGAATRTPWLRHTFAGSGISRFFSITTTTRVDHDVFEGEIVSQDETDTFSTAPKVVATSTANIPLLQQEMEAEQQRLEQLLQSRMEIYKALQQQQEKEDLEKVEEALIQTRHVYEDLQYWDQAMACEERLAMLWTIENDDDNKDAPFQQKEGLLLKQAHSWYRRGRYHMHMDVPLDASKCYRRALAAYNEYYGEETYHADKGHAYMSLAGIQYAQGSYEEALRILQEIAEPHFRQHAGQLEKDATPHPDLFKCLQHQGVVYREMEDFSNALEYYQKAKDFLLSLENFSSSSNNDDDDDNDDDDKEAAKRAQLQAIELDIADMHLVLNHLDDALDLYKSIWEKDRQHRARNATNNNTNNINGVPPLSGMDGLMLHNIGRIYAEKQGDDEAAIEALQSAVDMKKAWFGPLHPEVGKSMQLLGAVHARCPEQSYEALRCFEHCLKIARHHSGGNDNDPNVMLALRNIAILEGKKVPKWTEDTETKHS